MTYWGYDNGSFKFRCPHMTGKVNCPMGTNWCSSSNYGAVVKKKISDNPRYFTYPRRGTAEWQELYNERTSVERTFARLKENLGLNNITVRGIRTVSYTHLDVYKRQPFYLSTKCIYHYIKFLKN